MPNITSVAEVRTLINTDLDDDQLDALIARVESRLAQAVGLPTGERDYTAIGGSGLILLPVPAASVSAVAEFGYGYATTPTDLLDTDWQLVGDRTLVRLPVSYHWGNSVVVTYTPRDFTPAWKDAAIDLVRLRLSRRGYKSERVGSEWGYTAPDWEAEETAIIARLSGGDLVFA